MHLSKSELRVLYVIADIKLLCCFSQVFIIFILKNIQLTRKYKNQQQHEYLCALPIDLALANAFQDCFLPFSLQVYFFHFYP